LPPYFAQQIILRAVEQGQAWRDFNRGAKLDEAHSKILEELKSSMYLK
jgi:hypothetical protein